MLLESLMYGITLNKVMVTIRELMESECGIFVQARCMRHSIPEGNETFKLPRKKHLL